MSGKPGEERAEAKLVCCIKTLEGLHAAKEHLCKVAVLLRGFDEVAPLRRQEMIPARRRSLFCSRICTAR
jgi:hypothetical protein